MLSGCGAETEEEDAPEVFEVQRGPLIITIPAYGNLVMPQQVELRFGTFGAVEQVYVEEGDFVRAGTLLAKLDDTGKKLDIKSAQYDLQRIITKTELERAVGGQIGDEEINASYVSPEPWTEQNPSVLWGALLVALLVLGYLAVRSLRQSTN